MKRSVRSFVAVETSAAVRQRAVALIESLAAVGADVKWVAPENLHLTIKFLDEVALAEIPRVCDAVARAVAGVKPFELQVRGAGAFPTACAAEDHLAGGRRRRRANGRPLRRARGVAGEARLSQGAAAVCAAPDARPRPL